MYENVIIERINRGIQHRVNERYDSCSRLNLEKKSIENIESNLFHGFDRLKYLHLQNNHINNIQSDALDDLKQLQELRLFQNYLKKVESRWLEKLLDLTVLYFSYNKIETIESNAFSKLTKLEILYLNSNYLTSFPENLFQNLSSLKDLRISGNFLEDIKRETFANLITLEILYLPHNKIRKIEAGSFDDLKSLKLLNLGDNLVENLDERLFDNLENLEELYLSENYLTTLDSEILFRNLSKLKNLNLSLNKITRINPNVFRGLKNKMNDISLYGNKLDSFSVSTKLIVRDLSLDNNCLTFLDLSNVRGLQKLVLFNNKLKKIKQNHFKNLTSLNGLYLSNNEIEDIDETGFDDLTELKELVLSSNKIDQIKSRWFKKLTNLERLYIYDNNLTKLDSNQFTGLENRLEYLYLFGNKINSIDANAFNGLKRLKILLLNNNSIKNSEWISCQSFRHSLEILNLNSNNIETLDCMDHFNLTDLSLFNNNIKLLPEDFFMKSKKLKSVDLENNLIQNFKFLKFWNVAEGKIYLKNNRTFRIRTEEAQSLLRILRSIGSIDLCLLDDKTKSSYQNLNTTTRINKSNIDFLKTYYVPERVNNLKNKWQKDEENRQFLSCSFEIEAFLEYFQYIPQAISFNSDIKRKLKMFNLITGMNKETRNNFLKLIQNQNQKENIIILQLECDTKVQYLKTEECPLMKSKQVNSYIDAIQKFWNQELPKMESNKIIEKEIGHTSKFKQIEKAKLEIECNNKNNKSFIIDLDEKEIFCLIKRIKQHTTINHEAYIKRQLLKKFYFHNLHVLINLDIIYEKEIDQINEFLNENQFKYSILKLNNGIFNEDVKVAVKLYEIQLYNHETKHHIKLNDLNKVDYLKLSLLLIKRDRDIIKFNAENYSQILLIDEIDVLCEYDEVNIDEAITLIRNSLVNYMNIQVVATINCPEYLKVNKELILEIYQEKDAVDKVALRKYDNYLNLAIKNEIDCLNEKRKKNDNNLKNEIKELNDEKTILKKENEYLKTSVARKNDEISIIVSENDSLKDIVKKALNPSKVENYQIQINQTPRLSESSSNISIKIGEFLTKFQNKTTLSKEETLSFIEMLQEERNCLDGLGKSIICGSIKNLASNLYTSSIHYLYEILQNFEDTKYENKGTVHISINRSFIIFANNEVGFTANDVNSICSLSNSEKQLNTHIGNKGIGFKSCFLCTNNPVIVSKPWRFQFKVEKNNELSYITPLPILNDLPDDLKNYMRNNNTLRTFIYFPFKQLYENEYFENLLNSIDENILLFTKNINQLVVEDEINRKKIVIRREIIEEANISLDTKIKTKRVVLFQNDEIHKEFRVFEINGNQRSDNIQFAFPIKNKDTGKFSIYSVFPICDLKLNFLLSSYWIQTTNRETVNEYDARNIEMKQYLIELLYEIIKKDEFVSTNLLDYLPNLDCHTTSWWKSFILEFERKIRPVIDDKYQNFRIYDDTIDKLVDRNEFKHIGINIIDKANENISFYIRKLSIIDLLKLLQVKTLAEYDDKWWENFFKFLRFSINYFEDKIVLNELYTANIFLVDSKRKCLEQSDKVFVNDAKKDFKSTCFNHKISLIDYSSDSEKKFLKEILNLKETSEELIIKIILYDHLNEEFSKETLLDDMDFIKNNFYTFKECVKELNDYCLCLPVKDTKFALIDNATISTIFSVDMTSGMPLLKTNTESYKFIEYPRDNLKQCLEYEIFYLKLKCSLPNVNSKLMLEKIELKDDSLPLLNIIKSEMKEDEISLANEIFDLLSNEYISDVIHKLPVKIDNGDILSISETCLSSDSGYNSIKVGKYNKDLAMRFGVKESNEMAFRSIISSEPILIPFIQTLIIDDVPPIPKNDRAKTKAEKFFNLFSSASIDSDNVKNLIENYNKRIYQQDVYSNHDDFEVVRIEKTRENSNIIFNFEERINTGCQAELYFFLYLQHHFNDTLILEDCWISSLRTRLFPDSIDNCDDSKGYDFEILDEKKLFSKNPVDITKKCLIEVKGFKHEWEGTFVLTKNEIKRKIATENSDNELYFIVIIENVGFPDRIRLAEVINWTENIDSIKLIEPESYKYEQTKYLIFEYYQEEMRFHSKLFDTEFGKKMVQIKEIINDKNFQYPTGIQKISPLFELKPHSKFFIKPIIILFKNKNNDKIVKPNNIYLFKRETDHKELNIWSMHQPKVIRDNFIEFELNSFCEIFYAKWIGIDHERIDEKYNEYKRIKPGLSYRIDCKEQRCINQLRVRHMRFGNKFMPHAHNALVCPCCEASLTVRSNLIHHTIKTFILFQCIAVIKIFSLPSNAHVDTKTLLTDDARRIILFNPDEDDSGKYFTIDVTPIGNQEAVAGLEFWQYQQNKEAIITGEIRNIHNNLNRNEDDNLPLIID